MDKRMMQLRKAWVEEKEKLIVFGNGKTWMDIEADEATFTTTDFKGCAEDPASGLGAVVWHHPARLSTDTAPQEIAPYYVCYKITWSRRH